MVDLFHIPAVESCFEYQKQDYKGLGGEVLGCQLECVGFFTILETTLRSLHVSKVRIQVTIMNV